MSFITEEEKEQWIVDRLISHEECKDVFIEVLDDEVMLCCEDCQEIILNFFKEGAFD